MIGIAKYDTIIVGGSAAGLTAAIYTGRRGMKTLVITKNLGGQVSLTDSIENYPGFTKVGGIPLIKKMLRQAKKSGAKIKYEEVNEITEVKNEKSEFIIKTTAGKKYRARTVILCNGKIPRTLGVPGETEFGSKGVSYCVICDGLLFKGKIVVVVGGGNSALEGVDYLSEICSKVYLIHRRDQFRGFEYLVERIKNKPNVELILNSVVKKIKGEQTVKSILVQNIQTQETKELITDGVFIEIGYVTKTDFVKDLVKLDEWGQIIINNNCETYYPNNEQVHPGIFAAGDVTHTPFKQIAVATGEGCKAALQAYNYLSGTQPAVIADWVHKKK